MAMLDVAMAMLGVNLFLETVPVAVYMWERVSWQCVCVYLCVFVCICGKVSHRNSLRYTLGSVYMGVPTIYTQCIYGCSQHVYPVFVWCSVCMGVPTIYTLCKYRCSHRFSR